jgi:beta-glucanase (GH16 family)
MRASTLLLLSVPLAAAATSFCDPNAAGWTLDWEDNFDGDSLDLSSWTPLTSDGGGNIGSCRDAYCTPANVAVANGTLILTSKAESMMGYNYTTGAVNTSTKRSWKPSPTMRLCFSAILPGWGNGAAHAGAGVWPAGWMMPDVPGCWVSRHRALGRRAVG